MYETRRVRSCHEGKGVLCRVIGLVRFPSFMKDKGLSGEDERSNEERKSLLGENYQEYWGGLYYYFGRKKARGQRGGK